MKEVYKMDKISIEGQNCSHNIVIDFIKTNSEKKHIFPQVNREKIFFKERENG